MSKVCLNPQHYLIDGVDQYFPCGRCPNCRDLNRIQMASRLLLEKACHPEYDIFFLSLTYDEGHLPGKGFDPSHLDGFLDNLRKRCSRLDVPATFRYLLVGEYGDLEKRQHFHVLFLTSRAFPYRLPKIELSSGFWVFSNDFVDLVRLSWIYGHVDDGGHPSPAAVLYTCGYALKEDEFTLVHEDELRALWMYKHNKALQVYKLPKRLARLQPYIPIRRFSLRPGLGLDDKTVEFVFRYMYNDGVHFRFSIDLGDGCIVPVPGIYLQKFEAYGTDNVTRSTFGSLCKSIRKRWFEGDQQDDLSKAYDRCPDDTLSRHVREMRVKNRLEQKIQKVLTQQLNIYRHEI